MKLISLISLVLIYNYVPCEGNIIKKGYLAIKASFRKTDASNQTTFYLYTRNNPTNYQILDTNDENSFRNSNFNSEWPIRILIHGFQASGQSKMAKIVKDEYLKNGDFNVIAVDWSPIARKINYNYVVKNLKKVADIIADFAIILNEEYNIEFNHMYLIGHSLGAQIAGLVGRRVVPQQFNTIFALDPASPKFRGINNEDRVDMTDAVYVESIHTNIYNLGYKEPIGHASFYPNYGKTQPGCNFGSCVKKASCSLGCSHRRSYEYFAESINSNEFWGIKCDEFNEILHKNCTSNFMDNLYLMGGEPSVQKNGIFYVPTESKSPFAKGFQVL